MLLHTNCLPTELDKPANQSVIAATFLGCDDVPLTPDTKLAKCSDIPAAQTLTLAGQTLSISGGNSVVLPAGADDQQLSISGNVISLTDGGSVTLPTTAAPIPQVLSLAGNTVSLSGGGGSVTIPDLDTQDLSLSGNVLSLTNGGSVTLPTAAQDPYATPAQTIAGTATALIVNPADLYARENIPAQTGLGLNLAVIPAPTANQSPWGVNTLGETLHYAPGLGWRIVAGLHQIESAVSTNSTPTQGVWVAGATVVAPRAGKVVITGWAEAFINSGGVVIGSAVGLMKNGVVIEQHNVGAISPVGTPAASASGGSSPADIHMGLAFATTVAAGDTFSAVGQVFSDWTIRNKIQITYTA